MARITAGLATSHVPAIGAAIDLGKTERAVLGAGVRRLRVDQGVGRSAEPPDVVILVYNDHASALRPGDDPDLRDRLRRRVRAGRRGLGAAAGARWSRATPSSPRTSRSR